MSSRGVPAVHSDGSLASVSGSSCDGCGTPGVKAGGSEGGATGAGGFDEDLLAELRCPITQEPMLDPVVAADGETYERSAIKGRCA